MTPFQQNLKKLGIDAHSRIVDATQLKSRTDSFDFDIMMRASGGSLTPGAELRQIYGSASANMPASPNLAGIADPAIDALVESGGQCHDARRAQHRLPRARSRAARRPLLGSGLVQRLVLGRLVERLFPPRPPTRARRRRAGHLVVGRGEGEEDWFVRWGIGSRHSAIGNRAQVADRVSGL